MGWQRNGNTSEFSLVVPVSRLSLTITFECSSRASLSELKVEIYLNFFQVVLSDKKHCNKEYEKDKRLSCLC